MPTLTPREHFDQRAPRYLGDLYEGPASNHYQVLLRRRRDLLTDLIQHLDGPALELGCGPGVLTAALERRGKVVLGDISFQMVQIGKGNAGDDVTGAQLSAVELPFRSGSFGLVVAAGLLEYLDDEEAGLREIHRMLRPGGAALISFPVPKPVEHLLQRILASVGGLVRTTGPQPARLPARRNHEHGIGSARRMLERNGFHIERTKPFHYFYYPWSRLLFGPSRGLDALFGRLAHVVPPMGHLAQSFIVQVRRA